MNITIFLTTRYHSTRLFAKPLMIIGEDTVTDILIERLKNSGLDIIMVTPMTTEDNLYMSNLASEHGIGFFAGNNKDIIQRHLDCAAISEIDWIINVDGDDILTCPDLILGVQSLIEHANAANYEGFNYDCIQLIGYPLGMNLIAYTPGRLAKVDYHKDTNWGSKVLAAGQVLEASGTQYNECRLTLDYIPDYIVISHIIKELGKKVDSKEICDYMSKHPGLCAVNWYLNDIYYQRLADLSK